MCRVGTVGKGDGSASGGTAYDAADVILITRDRTGKIAVGDIYGCADFICLFFNNADNTAHAGNRRGVCFLRDGAVCVHVINGDCFACLADDTGDNACNAGLILDGHVDVKRTARNRQVLHSRVAANGTQERLVACGDGHFEVADGETAAVKGPFKATVGRGDRPGLTAEIDAI